MTVGVNACLLFVYIRGLQHVAPVLFLLRLMPRRPPVFSIPPLFAGDFDGCCIPQAVLFLRSLCVFSFTAAVIEQFFCFYRYSLNHSAVLMLFPGQDFLLSVASPLYDYLESQTQVCLLSKSQSLLRIHLLLFHNSLYVLIHCYYCLLQPASADSSAYAEKLIECRCALRLPRVEWYFNDAIHNF